MSRMATLMNLKNIPIGSEVDMEDTNRHIGTQTEW
jgi:hypothetical protein